jgi:hypothetical protein
MILSCLKRLDGQGAAYVTHDSPLADPLRVLARNLYETKGEAFPGQQASLAWELAGWWRVDESGTVDAAMRKAGLR